MTRRKKLIKNMYKALGFSLLDKMLGRVKFQKQGSGVRLVIEKDRSVTAY